MLSRRIQETRRRKKRKFASSAQRRRRILRMETCEPRMMLAGDVYSVDTTDDTIADDGMLSLREAVIAANQSPGSRIELPAGTYTLTTQSTMTDSDEYNDLDITTGVTIQGNGSDQTIIDASGLTGADQRVFHIFNASASSLVSSVSLTVNEGTAAARATPLNDLDGNNTDYESGDSISIIGTNNDGTEIDDIFDVDDTTTVGDLIDEINLRFNDSTLTLDSGGNLVLAPDSNGSSDFGVTLSISDSNGNEGSTLLPEFAPDDALVPNVRITGVSIEGGRADVGAGIYNQYGRLTILDSLIQNNSASDAGGGIYNLGGSVSVEGSRVKDNNATNTGAGFHNVGGLVTLVNTPLTGNTLGADEDGQFLEDIGQLINDSRDSVVEGINGIFNSLETSLRDSFAEVEVPGLGNRLNEFLEPTYDRLDQVKTGMAGFFDALLGLQLPDSAPTLQELLQYGFYVILGPGISPPADVVANVNYTAYSSFPQGVQDALLPLTQQMLTLGGLNILQDGIDTDGDVSPTDILVTVGHDEFATRWIELGFHVGQQLTFDSGGGFDLGLHSLPNFFGAANADRFQGDSATQADKDQYAQFLTEFGFGAALESSSGLRVDAKWDARLGFGMSERLGRSGSLKNGFYINGGQTVSGRPDDEPIEELRMSVEIFAAPNNEAVTFGQLFEDTVTTPNLKATASIGLLEATISDGTAAEVKITAPNPIDFDLGGTLFGLSKFDLDITRDGGTTTTHSISLNGIANALTAPFLLPTLNAQLYAEFGSILPPVAFNVDFSPIDTFYVPGSPNTPFLNLTAREPDISHLAIRFTDGYDTGGQFLGFLETQYEDRRAKGFGFGNNTASTLQNGMHVLEGDLPAPASGVVVEDPDFRIWVGGTRNGDVTEGADSIRIYWQEILNRTITELESNGDPTSSLEERFQQEIDDELSAAGLPQNIVADVFTDSDGNLRFKLTSDADTLITVTYQAVDQSKLSLTAAIDITSADYEKDASFLRDFPNDQRNFNRLTLGEVETTSVSDILDIFDPNIKAETQLRLHVRTGGSEVLAEEMQVTGLTTTPFGIPEISFDFKFDAAVNFDAAIEGLTSDDDDFKLFGDFFSIDTLQFANLTLNVQDFLQATLIPVAEAAAKAVDPVLGVVGGAASGIDSLFDARIPIVSDLRGKKTTLADAFNIPQDDDGDTAIDRFIDTIDGIRDLSGNINLGDFGNFVFGDFDIVLDPDSLFYFPRTKTPVPSSLATMEEQIKGLGAENFMRSYVAFDTFTPPGLSVDLFRPQTFFDIVTGQPFNIISFGLPTIDFDAGFEGSFGFEGFDIGLAAYATFDSNLRLVYDSRGLEDIVGAARAGTAIDWADLVNGFAIQNNPGGFEFGGSLDIFTWDGTRDVDGNPIAGEVGIKTDVIELSALVDVGATLGLEILDPNNDGKLRLDEINDITNNFKDPENLACLFDITGSAHFNAKGTAKFLDVGGSAELDVGVESFSLQDMLSGLFGICSGNQSDPILAEDVYIDDQRVLRINTGPYAASRLHGDVNDSEDPVKRVVEDPDSRFVTVYEPDGTSTRYDIPDDIPGNPQKYRVVKKEDLPQASTGTSLQVDDSTTAGTVQFIETDQNDVSTTIANFVEDRTTGRYFRSDVVDSTFLTLEGGVYQRWSQDLDADSYLKKSGEIFEQFIEGDLFKDSVTTFNSAGNIDVITDWLKATTEFHYDSDDRLIEVVERAANGNRVASYDYYHGVESLSVSNSTGDIVITGYGVTQTYSDTYDKIIAVGADLNDTFNLAGVVGIPVEITGLDGNDNLYGGDDDDVIDGGDGDDDIDAGDGNDTITVGAGFNMVDDTGGGHDYYDLRGDEHGVTLNLKGGNDTVIGSDYADTITVTGGSGNVWVEGRGGDDTITGGAGDDSLFGGNGDDEIKGGAGDDNIEGNDGADTLYGGADNDSVDGGSDDDVLYSGDGSTGGDGQDELFGGTGDDEMTVGLNTLYARGWTGTDSLAFLMDASDHTGTLSNFVYAVEESEFNDTFYYEVETLSVELGDGTASSPYSLTVNRPRLPLTEVLGGTGPDEISIVGLPATIDPADNSTTIDLGDSADTFTIFDTQRELDVSGEDSGTLSDTLVIDRSDDITSRSGKLTATAITGLGMEQIAYDDFEKFKISLGEGNDQFTIRNTYSGSDVTVQGNEGDDRISVRGISGDVVVNGGNGGVGTGDVDTVRILIGGVPADGAFTDLNANVEHLQIDNSANASARIDWSYEALGGGAIIYASTNAGTNEVIDTLGAELTIFNGGGSNSDTLTIEDLVDVSQNVYVDGNHVEIQEGADVLSFIDPVVSDPTFDSETISLDDLAGISDVVASPDGKHVYVLGADAGAITAFRRATDGSLTFVQVLRDGEFGVTGLASGVDMDFSADGESLYVTNGVNVALFSRVAETGRLVFRASMAQVGFPYPWSHVAVNPSGDHVFVSGNTAIGVYARDSSTGRLTLSDLIPNQNSNSLRLVASGDETHVFLMAASPSSTVNIQQYKLSSAGKLSLIDTVTPQAADFIVNSDGSELYTVSRGEVKTYEITNSGMTSIDTVSVQGNPFAKAVAIDPAGPNDSGTPRLLTSFDIDTPVPDPVVTLKIQNISVVGEEGDLGGDWELSIKVDGSGFDDKTVWGQETLKKNTSKDINFSFQLTDSTVLKLFEKDPDNNQLLDTATVKPEDVPGGSLIGNLEWSWSDLCCSGSVNANYSYSGDFTLGPKQNAIQIFEYDSDDTLNSIPGGAGLSGTPFFDMLTVNPGSDGVYAVKNDVDAVEVFTGSGKSLSHLETIADGDTQTFDLPELSDPHFTKAIVSDDGEHIYSVSSRYGTIDVFEWDSSSGEIGNKIQNIDAGILPGSTLAFSSPGATATPDSIFVSNPAEDSIYVYLREDSTTSSDFGKLTLDAVFTDGVSGVDGLDGVSDIAVSEDGSHLYALGTEEDAIAIFSIDSSTGDLSFEDTVTHADLDEPVSLAVNGNVGSYLYVGSAGNDSLLGFSRSSSTGDLTYIETFTDNVGGVSGLGGISDVVFSGDTLRDNIYVAGSHDDGIAVFSRDVNTGQLTFQQSLTNGQGGVLGIEGVTTLASTDQYVVAASAEDSVAVFSIGLNGKLTLLQRLNDGAADGNGNEVMGLDVVTSMVVSPSDDYLIVGRGGKQGDFGGLASFEIAQSIGTPDSYLVDYFGMETLNIKTQNAGDFVTAGEVEVNFNVSTGGGADWVTLRDAPENRQTELLLGDDSDFAELYTTGDGSTVEIKGQGGRDSIVVYGTGTNSTTELFGGNGADTFEVKGGHLESEVEVIGSSPTGSSGDELRFDAHGNTVDRFDSIGDSVSSVSLPDGQLRMNGETYKVIYKNIEEVTELASPLADAGGPYDNFEEGDVVTFDARGTKEPSGATTTYDWLIGSSIYTTKVPVLFWSDLQNAGIDDDGTYTVAVRVTSDVQGELFTDIATTQLTISNLEPDRDLAGASSVELGQAYELSLSATDPGDDQITQWEVDWGDGSAVETYPGPDIVVTHAYEVEGDYDISVTSSDEDGGPYTDQLQGVTVNPSRSISGPVEVTEGASYQLTLNNPAGADIQDWHINWGDGITQLVPGSTSSKIQVSHTYADNGVYQIRAETVDADGSPRNNLVPLDMVVRNVAPTLHAALINSNGVPFGVQVTQGVSNVVTILASDPGSNDTLTYELDFDGDGKYELASATSSFTHPFNNAGTFNALIRVRDNDGDVSNVLSFDVNVTNVAPSVSLSQVSVPAREGLVAIFEANGSDPGDELLTYEWDFDGDGNYELNTQTASTAITVFPDNDSYDVSVRVTDADGAQATDTITVDVENVAPLFNSTTIYGAALEGSPVDILASAFDYAGVNDTLTYDFDFGDDNSYEVLGSDGSTTFTFADDGTYPVRVRVSDGDGGKTEIATSIVVRNVVPTVNITGPDSVREGETFTISLGDVVDPGDDTVTDYYVNWGDGISDSYTAAEVAALGGELTHAYERVIFEQKIELVVEDEDGLHKAGEYDIFVTGSAVIDGVLFVIGYEEDDHVTINAFDYGEEADGVKIPGLKVHASFISEPAPDGEDGTVSYQAFDATDITKIVIYTHGGSDRVSIAGSVSLPVIINGGDGDDDLNGGNGPTVLVGGAGDDVLKAGNGHDILIGGEGSDDLSGKQGDDVLVADKTDFDGDLSNWLAFDAWLNEWNSSRSYADRVGNLRQGTGEFLAGTGWRLEVGGDDPTVVGDGHDDELRGDKGTDWYLAEATDEIKKHDSKLGELIDTADVEGTQAGSSLDVNNDGRVSAIDALMVINMLGHRGSGIAGEQTAGSSASLGRQAIRSQADVNGDGVVSALDALTIINGMARVESRSQQIAPPMSSDSASDDWDEDEMLTLLANDVVEVWE